MRTDRKFRSFTRLAAAAAVAASATTVLAGTFAVPAGAVVTGPYASKVVVSSSATKFVSGQAATFTAKVSAGTHGVPGGQVTFSITGADSSTVSCDAGNVQTLAGGLATCSVAAGLSGSGGPFTVVAQYADTVDTNYLGSSGTKVQTVALGSTTTTVTSSQNPSVTGQTLDFTAAVALTAPAVGTPTGTVTFSGVTCDGGTNAIPVSGGLAQCQIAAGLPSKTGTYTVTGAYGGDTNFAGSSSLVRQSVKPAAATVTLAPSAGVCTGDLCTVGQGTAVSFTATAAATGTDGGTGTPQGTITFSLTRPGSSATLPCDGGTNNIATVAGTATCTIAAGLPAVLYYKVTATLTASGYQSSSASLFENTSLTGTSLVVTIPKGGAGAGESFDVTATITVAAGYTGSNTPGGFVNLAVCGYNSNGWDGCQGGAVPVGPGGVATLLIGGGEYPGAYTAQAVYTGDSNFYSSTAKTKSFYVGKSATTLTLSEPGGFYSEDGAPVVITASLAAPNGAAGSTLVGPPTGNITFSVTDPNGVALTCLGGNTMVLPVDPKETEGSVTCVLPPGTLTDLTPPATQYTIHANYSGDSDYTMSGGGATQTVVPIAT